MDINMQLLSRAMSSSHGFETSRLEPRTITESDLMRSVSVLSAEGDLGGSEYFLFPGANGENLFVKVVDDMALEPKRKEMEARKKAAATGSGGSRGRMPSKGPVGSTSDQSDKNRRSRSAGSIYSNKRSRNSLHHPSPVASYINQSDSGRGSRTSFMSTDSSEDTALPSNDSTDNVSVVVRVRPLVEQEVRRGDEHVVQNLGSGSLLIDNGCSKPFTFNAVFDEHTSQSEFFENCGVMRLVDKALEGFSCTVFAYGPTGSGKTHTITGPVGHLENVKADQFGLIQRSFMYLFNQINAQNDVFYYLKVSYLEVYNEKVKDLLNPAGPDSLKIRWTKNKGFHVENLFTVECETINDIMIILEEGINHRQMGVSNSNEHSSRSHCLLLCEVLSESVSPDDNTMYIHKNGNLTFVDLAGSEKLNQTGDGNLAETTNINKSLLALGNCISCLSDTRKRSGHIPYRESKLTQLLADSLGGNGVTLMVACVSPSSSNMTESLNTLRYANRAKKIKNKPYVMMDPREKEIVSLRREVGALRAENEYLRSQIDLPKEQTITQLAAKSAQLKLREESGDDNSSLYEMVQAYMIENEKLRRDTSELTHGRDKLTHQLQDLSQENIRLVKKLEQFESAFMMMQQNSNQASAPQNGRGHLPPFLQNGGTVDYGRGGGNNLAKLNLPSQLTADQQNARKTTGLPPVTSNKGVPNGLTSPRRSTQYNARSPDRRFTNNTSGSNGAPRAPQSQTQTPHATSNSNSRASIKSNSQGSAMYNQTAARHTSETNRTSERNYDSGVFSDEENDPRRSISDRMNKSQMPPSVPNNGTIASRGTKNPNISAEYLNNKTQLGRTPSNKLPSKPGSTNNFTRTESNELAEINEKLLKDIQSLDSEIELYQQRVKKPKK